MTRSRQSGEARVSGKIPFFNVEFLDVSVSFSNEQNFAGDGVFDQVSNSQASDHSLSPIVARIPLPVKENSKREGTGLVFGGSILAGAAYLLKKLLRLTH